MSQSLEFKIPEGYVFDKENSTDSVIRFKPIKIEITYKDVCRELFLSKPSWRLLETGVTKYTAVSDSAISCSRLTATSNKQLEQLVALNKLMNVAKYLNGDWEPDWNNSRETKWCLFFDYWKQKIIASNWQTSYYGCVYFKSEKLAYQAIEILGEEAVKKALGVFK